MINVTIYIDIQVHRHVAAEAKGKMDNQRLCKDAENPSLVDSLEAFQVCAPKTDWCPSNIHSLTL